MTRQEAFNYFSAIVLIPTLIYLTGAILQSKDILIWHIRVIDFIDLVVAAPFFLIYFSVFLVKLLPSVKDSRTSMILLFSALMFLYGHAMHLAANMIHTFAVEAKAYTLPTDLQQLIYFLDEDLSHIVLFTGAYVFTVALVEISSRLPKSNKNSSRAVYFPIFLGIFYGFFQALAFISASKVWLMSILGLILFGYAFYVRRRDNQESLTQNPMQTFIFTFIPTLFLTATGYYLAFGAFISPFVIVSLWG